MNNQCAIKISAIFISSVASIIFFYYLLILLNRTEYGNHQTSIGTDVITMCYLLAGTGLSGFIIALPNRWIGLKIGLAIVTFIGIGLLIFLTLNQSGKIIDRSVALLITIPNDAGLVV